MTNKALDCKCPSYQPDPRSFLATHNIISTPSQSEYDLIIIGSGPAGLTAAIRASSESLKVLVIERHILGGQAATSSHIENMYGHVSTSGAALTEKALEQAIKFGVEFISATVVNLVTNPNPEVWVENWGPIGAKSILIASGMESKPLNVPGLSEVPCVYYGALPADARMHSGQHVTVIGAGNSAGQAILYLADYAQAIDVLVRGPSLETSMSQYLIDRIRNRKNVNVVLETQMTHVWYDEVNKDIYTTMSNKRWAATQRTKAIFVFVGSVPATSWFKGEKTSNGYIITGKGRRSLETNRPGIFAAGDARFESNKSVASAAGEGGAAVAQIHQFIKEHNASA